MNAPVELSDLSGLDQIRAIFAGKTGYQGMVKTLNLHPVSAEEGFVVFEGSPTQAVYNPLGVVHGGYAATDGRIHQKVSTQGRSSTSSDQALRGWRKTSR
jgi:hypothetical protein